MGTVWTPPCNPAFMIFCAVLAFSTGRPSSWIFRKDLLFIASVTNCRVIVLFSHNRFAAHLSLSESERSFRFLAHRFKMFFLAAIVFAALLAFPPLLLNCLWVINFQESFCLYILDNAKTHASNRPRLQIHNAPFDPVQ